jgi:hypothetical protein
MVTKRVKKGFAAEDDPDRDLFVLVARAQGFRLYHERILVTDAAMESTVAYPLVFDTPIRRLSAIAVCPNGNDITCGHWEGDMSIR